MTRRIFLTALATLAIPRRADATLYVVTSLDALIAMSTHVSLARVVASEAEWQGERIVSRVALEHEEAFLGSVAARSELLVPGGVVDGVGMRTLGYPVFRVGDRSILLLKESRAADSFRLVGAAQGRLDVTRVGGGYDVVRVPRTDMTAWDHVLLHVFRRSLRDAIQRVRP